MALTIFMTLLCLLYFSIGTSGNPVPVDTSNESSINTNKTATDYDVVVVGGGPAGLSALGSLARVRRRVLLIDSGTYRNAPSRRVHDVIGSDGLTPALFRARAREQLTRYPNAKLQNGTVISIIPTEDGSSFTTIISSGQNYTSRKIILATGLRDILPNVPGIEEAWGRGMYWCAWCDGWEHRDQALGIIAPINKVLSGVIQVSTINKDIVAFVNGTDTPDNRKLLDKTSPGWQKLLDEANVKLENRTITGFERVQDGDKVRDESTGSEYDVFFVNLKDGTRIRRSSFLASFPKAQQSYLGASIGVGLVGERISVDQLNMKAAPGVWGVGDANSNNVTNVPHALYSGKKAAVSAHFELGRETMSKSLLNKRSESDLLRDMDSGLEDLWNSIK